jgi:hypothetical protein
LKRLVLITFVVGVGLFASAQVASAYSSGSLTSAYANSEWTKASFNVSVSPGVCVGTGYCSYHPVVLAQPNLPSYACRSAEFGDSDPNTQVAWFGPTLTTNAPFSAAVAEASILNKVVGQRICLELVGENEYISPLCLSQQKVIEEFTGKPATVPCKPEKFFFQEYAFASALLEVAPVVTPPAATPAPVSTPTVAAPTVATPSTTKPKRKALKCPKAKKKVIRRGKSMCVKRPKHPKK